MGGHLSTIKRLLQPGLTSETSGSLAVGLHTLLLVYMYISIDHPQDEVQTPVVPDPNPECAGNDQGNDEIPGPGNQPQDMPIPSGTAMHTDEIEQTVITSTRFISSLGLQRLLMTR